MKIKRVYIKDYKGIQNLELDFSLEDKTLNLIVLSGLNGSGKTRILEFINEKLKRYDSLTESEKLEIELEKEEEVINIELKQKSTNLFVELCGFRKKKKYNSECSKYMMINKHLEKKPKIIYVPTESNFEKLEKASTELIREYSFLNVVDSSLIKDIPSYIATKIIETANNEEHLTMGQVRKKIFNEINEIFEGMELDIKISGISKDAKSLPLFENFSGEKVDINALSSGEKQLFLRTLSLKMLEPKNSIILIDEPELSLHPKWQQQILEVYKRIGENNQIIIATHSPLILENIDKENIFMLTKEESGRITVATGDKLYTPYGQPLNRTLKDIMGTKVSENPKVIEILLNCPLINRKPLIENYL